MKIMRMGERTWQIGVGYEHDMDFVIDRPRGSGDIVFLHFKTAIHLRSRAGMRAEKPGACILYCPPFAQWYAGEDAGFDHDWIHLPVRPFSRLMREYELPRNRVFRPVRTDFVAPLLAEIQAEIGRGELHAGRAAMMLAERLLLLLSRNMHDHGRNRTLTPRQAELREGLRELRRAMLQDLTCRWNVAEMAGRLHLSPSRFAVIYREHFGVSPMEDLLRARLERARLLLTNKALMVSEVAARSGFGNVYYFSRVFRRRVGCAPRDYCRMMSG